MKRRGFLRAVAGLVAAPAVIRVADLMPIKAVRSPLILIEAKNERWGVHPELLIGTTNYHSPGRMRFLNHGDGSFDVEWQKDASAATEEWAAIHPNEGLSDK